MALGVRDSMGLGVMPCPAPARWPQGRPDRCLLACQLTPARVPLPPLTPCLSKGMPSPAETPGVSITRPLSPQEASSA